MSDAIVILGHALNNDATIDETLKARLDLGKKLFFEKKAPIILLSGGIANKTAGVPEAVAMHEYLIKEGVPEERIITERNSLTTVQNAKYSAPILKSHNLNSITLVSSSYHLKRWYLNPVMLFKLYTGFKIKIDTAESE